MSDTPDRKSCLNCVLKHVSQAAVLQGCLPTIDVTHTLEEKDWERIDLLDVVVELAQAKILMEECFQGYPEHYYLAIGHLAEAGDEAVDA